jgi:hypothetical protein
MQGEPGPREAAIRDAPADADILPPPNYEIHVPWHYPIGEPGINLSCGGDHPNHETTNLAIPKKAATAITPRMMSRQLTASIALSSPAASPVDRRLPGVIGKSLAAGQSGINVAWLRLIRTCGSWLDKIILIEMGRRGVPRSFQPPMAGFPRRLASQLFSKTAHNS